MPCINTTLITIHNASVMELVDMADSKSAASDSVAVQVRPLVPNIKPTFQLVFLCLKFSESPRKRVGRVSVQSSPPTGTIFFEKKKILKPTFESVFLCLMKPELFFIQERSALLLQPGQTKKHGNPIQRRT